MLQSFGAHPAAAAQDGRFVHRGRLAQEHGERQVGLDKDAGDLLAFPEPFLVLAFGPGMLCGLPLCVPVHLAPPLRRQVCQRVQSETVQGKTVWSEKVQGKTVQSETVQSETLQGKTVQTETVQSEIRA